MLLKLNSTTLTLALVRYAQFWLIFLLAIMRINFLIFLLNHNLTNDMWMTPLPFLKMKPNAMIFFNIVNSLNPALKFTSKKKKNLNHSPFWMSRFKRVTTNSSLQFTESHLSLVNTYDGILLNHPNVKRI